MNFLQVCVVQLSFVDDLNGDLRRRITGKVSKITRREADCTCYRAISSFRATRWKAFVSHLTLCDAMPCQLHHSEVAFTDCLLNVVKSHFYSPLGSFRRHLGPCIRTKAPMEANKNAFEQEKRQGNVLFIWQRTFSLAALVNAWMQDVDNDVIGRNWCHERIRLSWL